MEEKVKWEGTIFDGNKWQEGLNMEDRSPLYYFVSIIMYCISFFYLFGKSLPSTYIVYVFVFILNNVFPFIWIKDFFSIAPTNYIARYRNVGVGVALSIQFFSLFLVVLTNENIRKMKVQSVSSDQNNNRDKKKVMTTNDPGTARDYKNIAILFVTITTLVWGVVGTAYSENKILSVDPTDKPLIQTIRWLLNQPYQIIYNFDTLWNNFMQRIMVSPLVKAFSMYCATFLVIFFGVFVRIPHFKHPLQHHPIDRFNIVNLGPMFPPVFKRNIDQYRSLTVFFLSLIISLIFAGLMFWLKSAFHVIPKNAIIGSTLAGFALFFGCFFGKRMEMFPDLFSVQKLVYFLLCMIFTVVGTPVILGVIQLLIESGILNVFQKFCFGIYSALTKTKSEALMLNTLNMNGFLGVSATVISIVLLFTMFGLGVDKKWVVNPDGKSMQMFTVTLITMSVSLFTALGTKYKICTALYTLIKTLVEFILVYLAPPTMVALAITQFVFSYKNYMKFKHYGNIKNNTKK